MLLQINKMRKAQSIMEYALLFSVVVGSLSVMQLYLRRHMNASIKQGADTIPGLVTRQVGGDAVKLFDPTQTQYEPYYMVTGNAGSDFDNTTAVGTEVGAANVSDGERVLTGRTRQRTGVQTIESHQLAD